MVGPWFREERQRDREILIEVPDVKWARAIERRLLALDGQQALRNPGFLYFESESDEGDPARETERHYANSNSAWSVMGHV